MSNNKDFLVNGPVVVGKDTKVTVGTITASAIDLSTGNYFDDTLVADTTYTLSNAGDVQAFQLEVTGGAVGYDLSSATYDSKGFSVAGQETNPYGMALSNDGTKMFIIGFTNDTVYQYSLSTAWDVSTASYDSVSFSVNSQDASPSNMAFNSDGTKMYVVGGVSDTVYQYSLLTAFDLNTASYDSVSFSVASQDTSPQGITFNSDGTKMYMMGLTNKSVFQYSLSTAFDISTASYDSVSFSVISQDSLPLSVSFSDDGTKMFVVGNSTDSVYQYSLSTAFDLSTASYDSVSFSVTSQDTGPYDVEFGNGGIKMYIVGNTNDTVFQYTTGSSLTITWPSSVEWSYGLAPSAPSGGETDVYTLVTDDGGTSYVGLKTADNLS